MWKVEVTDTFGGEANYCWVRRYTCVGGNLTNRQVVRRAKKLAGWSGLRARTMAYGDFFEVRPYGLCQVMFITWESV